MTAEADRLSAASVRWQLSPASYASTASPHSCRASSAAPRFGQAGSYDPSISSARMKAAEAGRAAAAPAGSRADPRL